MDIFFISFIFVFGFTVGVVFCFLGASVLSVVLTRLENRYQEDSESNPSSQDGDL